MVAVREHGLASAPTATATVAIRLVLLASLIHTAAASRALVNYGGNGAGTGEMTQCEGDCDSDSDCTSGLSWFQRPGYTAVPGCAVGGSCDVSGYDYCYGYTSYTYETWRMRAALRGGILALITMRGR